MENSPATSSQPPHQTRSSAKKCSTMPVPTCKLPGANFVDVDLRVAVMQSTGTAIGFQPEHLHGTTVGHGMVNHNITTSFSQRVADAWKEATATAKAIISGKGAGEGNWEGRSN